MQNVKLMLISIKMNTQFGFWNRSHMTQFLFQMRMFSMRVAFDIMCYIVIE